MANILRQPSNSNVRVTVGLLKYSSSEEKQSLYFSGFLCVFITKDSQCCTCSYNLPHITFISDNNNIL